MQPFSLRRRDLLQGIGAGLTLLFPFAKEVRAQASGVATGNFMVYYTPNGHVRSKFGSTGNGDSFTLKPSLAQGLNAFKHKMSVIHDIYNPGASSKGSHEDCVRTLTCVPGSQGYEAYGPSIDWVVAESKGQRPITLAASWGQAPNWQSKISWKAARVFDPHINDAKKAFDSLFAGVVSSPSGNSSSSGETIEAIHAQNKSILDFVKADIATLSGRLAAPDKVKLDLHMDAIREIEKTVTTVPASGAPLAACNTDGLATSITQNASDFKRSIEIKMDLIAAAFACGNRRAATLLTQGASGGRNPFGSPNHHDVSHFKGTNPQEVWAKIDAWYAERLAYLAQKLSDLQILDTTVIAWATEIAEGHYQNGFVIPLIGGSGLGLANRRTFTGNNSMSNIWVSVQKAMGIKKDTFGTKSTGGITGLYTGA